VAPWPTAAARAERFVRHGGFDVAHVHEPLAPMAAYGLVLTDPLPLVGTYHRAGVSRWVGPLHALTQLVGRRLQVRVAVSEAARETGRREGGGAFELLFNGVEMDRFESAPPALDAQGRPTVLFLGRHEPRKGLPVLLDAFAGVEQPAVLWVAGDGPGVEVQRRRQLASDRVQWLGRLSDDEVASRLAGADVLCAPSLHGESFGMVVLEGMAAGCAVVASDIEGYRAAAGGHATLVPPGDAAALARALDGVLAGVGSAASVQARKEATEYARAWSMDTLAERYLDLYGRAIEGFGATR
jgi:phosphatidylinositol alpha-mannosyltransferase